MQASRQPGPGTLATDEQQVHPHPPALTPAPPSSSRSLRAVDRRACRSSLALVRLAVADTLALEGENERASTCWLNGPVLNAGGPETVPRVRIPPPPS